MRTFLILLGVLLVIDLVAVGSHRNADPPIGFSQDHAFNIDGYWYLADARAAVDGSDSTVVASYHRPLITWPVQALYELGGVNHSTSRFLNVLASLTAIALLAFWIRRSYGSIPALAGAFLLALDPAWIACCRSTVVYPWVACWVILVLMVGLGGGWRRWAVGVGLTFFAAYAVKSIVCIVLPAFGIDAFIRAREQGWLRSRRAWGIAGIAAVVAAVALGPWTLPTFWRRIAAYTFGDGFHPLSQMLDYESRSRLFSTSGVIIGLAFAGLIVFRRWAIVPPGQSVKASRVVPRSVHAVVWITLGMFAVSRYTPLRYHVPLIPLIAFAAATPIAALLAFSPACSFRARSLTRFLGGASGKRFEIGALIVIGSYITLMMVWAAAASELPGVLGVAVVGSIAVVGVPFMMLRRMVREAVPTPLGLVMSILLVAVVVSFAAAPFIPQVNRAFASEETSLTRAARILPSVILPSARVAGPYAHVLTLETGHDAQQMNTLRFGDGELARMVQELDASHLATYHRPTERFTTIFERDGTPIELVERFQLRDRSVFLYRFTKSDRSLSSFEEGVRFLKSGGFAEAESSFRSVLRSFPDSAAAWCKLGVALREQKDFDTARTCFMKSLERDSSRVEAHVELANLYGSSGYLEEAYLHLGAAAKAAPDSDHLRSQFEKLREELGLGGEKR